MLNLNINPSIFLDYYPLLYMKIQPIQIICILLVIFFLFYSNCKGSCKGSCKSTNLYEGMDSLHMDEVKHIDGSKEEDNYSHVDINSDDSDKHPSLLNIYGEPLKSCRSRGSSDMRGSWNDGFCDEMGGGVHQICLDVDKTNKFSESTGQGPWSEGRKGANHCMCLGAWALYKARQEQGEIPKTYNELHCESIMDDALDERYVNNWNTWNGNELPDQIVQGVNQVMDQCYSKGTEQQQNYLINLYNNLTNDKPEFHNTKTYKQFN